MINLPESCPRGRTDCEPLSQILDDEDGFICCGFNDGKTRVFIKDKFRHCWKNEALDEMTDWDDRDLISTISVMSSALTAAANLDLTEPEVDSRPLYKVVCDPCEDWYHVWVPSVKGAFSQVKQLDRVDDTIREAIALVLNVDEDSFRIETEIQW